MDKEYMYPMCSSKPQEIIEFINCQHPELKGLCYYSADKKELESNDETTAYFHFDPYHGVLRIVVK